MLKSPPTLSSLLEGFYRSFSGMPWNEWNLQRSVPAATHPVHEFFESWKGWRSWKKKFYRNYSSSNNNNKLTIIPMMMWRSIYSKNKTFPYKCKGFYTYSKRQIDHSTRQYVAGHLVFRDRIATFWIKIRQF